MSAGVLHCMDGRAACRSCQHSMHVHLQESVRCMRPMPAQPACVSMSCIAGIVPSSKAGLHVHVLGGWQCSNLHWRAVGVCWACSAWTATCSLLRSCCADCAGEASNQCCAVVVLSVQERQANSARDWPMDSCCAGCKASHLAVQVCHAGRQLVRNVPCNVLPQGLLLLHQTPEATACPVHNLLHVRCTPVHDSIGGFRICRKVCKLCVSVLAVLPS